MGVCVGFCLTTHIIQGNLMVFFGLRFPEVLTPLLLNFNLYCYVPCHPFLSSTFSEETWTWVTSQWRKWFILSAKCLCIMRVWVFMSMYYVCWCQWKHGGMKVQFGIAWHLPLACLRHKNNFGSSSALVSIWFCFLIVYLILFWIISEKLGKIFKFGNFICC